MIYAADSVITQNDARDILERGAVAVEGTRIADVGALADVQARRPGDRVLDLGEAVIMPGLVNGHTHIPMSALRGFSDDKALMDWLQQDIFPVEARLTPEIVRTASLFSCAELLRTGCTALFDMYMLEDAVFAAVDEAGLRAVLGENVTQFYPGLSAPDEAAHFDRIRRYAREWKDHPRIRGAVAPHAVYTTNPGLLRRCRALADELGFRFGLHLSETVGETQACLAAHGLRPPEYCRSLGILRDDTTLFHMVDADDADLDVVASCGCAIVHNPASNMKLASGVFNEGAARRAGLRFGLGTDGASSNNRYDMFAEMRTAALLAKSATLDPVACSAAEIYRTATLDGFRLLRLDAGEIAPGKLADCILVDLDHTGLVPGHDLVSDLVYAANPECVDTTICAGRVLMRHRQIPGEDEVRRAFREVAARL